VALGSKLPWQAVIKGERSAGNRQPVALPHRAFWLACTIAAGLLAALAVGALTGEVLGHYGLARADAHVTAWLVAHRTDWLTNVLRVVTWLGSLAVIIPAGALAGLFFVLRGHRLWPAVLLASTIAGATGLYNIVKHLVGRPRPPPGIWVGHFSGASFPSGHAAQSVACYLTLAVLVSVGRPLRVKIALYGAATLVVLIVGGSRIYLGAHWLTDVLCGYALGAAWVAMVLAIVLTVWPRLVQGATDSRAGGGPN
jgi:membrane-associated phospholipid phosphatase